MFLAVGVLYRSDRLGFANLIDAWLPPRTIIREVKQEIVTSPDSDQNISQIAKKFQESTAMIQSYQDGKLIRFGSGLVMTQDGLIITIEKVVPVGAQSYQVLVNGKVFNAAVVKRDAKNNLALLKVDSNGLKPATFDDKNPDPGATLYVFGRIASLTDSENFVHKVFVNRLAQEKVFLDGRYEEYLSGAGLGNQKGTFHGLVYVDGQRIIALQSSFLEDFTNNYLK